MPNALFSVYSSIFKCHFLFIMRNICSVLNSVYIDYGDQ